MPIYACYVSRDFPAQTWRWGTLPGSCVQTPNGREWLYPGHLERGPQAADRSKVLSQIHTSTLSWESKPSSPKKLLMWGSRKPGKGWVPLWWKRRCGEKDEVCCRHSWWWPLWGRCWSTVFRNPSRAGHFDPLPSAAMTVTGAPQGFPNLLAMLDPAPPPELVMCPQKTPGLQHRPPGCSTYPKLFILPELKHYFRKMRLTNEN